MDIQKPLLLIFSISFFLISSVDAKQSLESLPTGLMPVLAEQLANDESQLYAPTITSSGLVVTNKKHQLEANFNKQDVTLSINNKELSIRLDSIGRGKDKQLIESIKPVIDGIKVSYQHKFNNSNTVNHWFINSPLGLEQGFTLNKKLAGKGDLKVSLSLKSEYQAKLINNNLQFKNKNQQTQLTYNQLVAFDAEGKKIPSRMLFNEKTNQLTLSVNDTQAIYPLIIDPLFSTEIKRTASDSSSYDEFGYSVAISGDTVVVGSRYDDDDGEKSGSAYIFQRNQGGLNNWGQLTKLVTDDAVTGDWFGRSVSISGDTVVIGANGVDDGGSGSGAAYIFQRDQGGINNWGQITKLLASDPSVDDRFGQAVAISGDTVVISANADDDNGIDSGSSYIFQRDQGGLDNWGQVTKLLASDGAAGDSFGYSVAIDANIILVGARADADNGIDSGSAYIFQRDQGGLDNWGQLTKLLPSDGSAGDIFSRSVSISDDTAVIGAIYNDDSGSAYVFQRDQGGINNWGQLTKLLASDAAAGDTFGISVSISGNTVVVGASHDDDNGLGSGSAYVFQRDQGGSNTWGQLPNKLLASDGLTNEQIGYSSVVSNDTIVLGSHKVDGVGIESGAIYIFGSNTDLSLTVRDDTDPVTVGNNYNYIVSVTSNDTLLSSDVSGFDLVLPSGLSFISADLNCTHLSGVVRCDINALSPTAFVETSIEVNAATSGTYNVTATLIDSSKDYNLTNNSDTEATNITAVIPDPAPSSSGGGGGSISLFWLMMLSTALLLRRRIF